MWVAARNIKIGRGEMRNRGELVPEAEHWKHRDVWVKAGHIVWVPDVPKQIGLDMDIDDLEINPESEAIIDAQPQIIQPTSEMPAQKKRGRPRRAAKAKKGA